MYETCLSSTRYFLHTEAPATFIQALSVCQTLHGPQAHLARPEAADRQALMSWLSLVSPEPLPTLRIKEDSEAGEVDGTTSDYVPHSTGESLAGLTAGPSLLCAQAQAHPSSCSHTLWWVLRCCSTMGGFYAL